MLFFILRKDEILTIIIHSTPYSKNLADPQNVVMETVESHFAGKHQYLGFRTCETWYRLHSFLSVFLSAVHVGDRVWWFVPIWITLLHPEVPSRTKCMPLTWIQWGVSSVPLYRPFPFCSIAVSWPDLALVCQYFIRYTDCTCYIPFLDNCKLFVSFFIFYLKCHFYTIKIISLPFDFCLLFISPIFFS